MVRTIQATLLVTCLMAAPAHGESDEETAPLSCAPVTEMLSPSEHLRAISLDVTGDLPTLASMQEVQALGHVPPEMVTQMLDGDDFAWQIVALHRDLLWPYLEHSEFYPTGFIQNWSTRIYYRLYGGVHWPEVYGRGGSDVGCRDEPEADPSNISPIANPDGTVQEGWVCVTPYFKITQDPWLDSDNDCPKGQIKVCAFDAQEALVSPNNGKPCTSSFLNADPGCGCGPNLRHCAFHQQFHPHLLASYERAIHWTLANDRPYHEMFTQAPLFVNGPLVAYYKHFAKDLSFSKATLPALDYQEDVDTWIPLPISPNSSGVLTHVAYRQRFMSNRARMDRFYNAFLCSPFEPPAAGFGTANDDALTEPDLQKRPGCKYCHSTIEPAAAYWGHWGEIKPRFLDAETYPDFDPICYECATAGNCTERCERQYVTSVDVPQAIPFLGYLNAFLFLADEDWVNISQGPKLLVERSLLDGRLASCATRNVAVWLLGRELLPDEESWLETLVDVFVASNYDVKELAYAIVTSDFYRRVR